MTLIKLGHENAIKDGERIVKESYDRCVVLIKHSEGKFYCFELPDSAFAEADVDKISAVPGSKKLNALRDNDGELWVILPPQIKPEVDKSFKVPTEPGSVLGIGTDVPPPLVPFAGCDRKAMPPSPAKPFSLPASPYKPSPFKERVDCATEAVVKKNFAAPPAEGKWSQRQAKMGEFFGPKKKVVATEQPLDAALDA